MRASSPNVGDQADLGVQVIRRVLEVDSSGAIPAAIPAAGLRRTLGGILDCVEQAGRLLADVEDPECQHNADERRWLKAKLLAVLPVPAEVGDVNDATAELLTVIPGETCAVVTSWLAAGDRH
jgi:hypothetical protein